MKVNLDVDGKPTEVDTGDARVTMLYSDGTITIKPTDPNVVVIDPEMTVAAAQQMARPGNHGRSWSTLRKTPKIVSLWHRVFGPKSNPPEDLATAPIGMQHVAGMLVVVMGVIMSGKTPYLKYPETYLHPKYQLGLADAIMFLSDYFAKKGKL